MTRLDRRRVTALESGVRVKTPVGLREATQRLHSALRKALPSIPGTETRRVSQWVSQIFVIPGGCTFDELLAELAGRITDGTTTTADMAVCATLDPADLATVGEQSAESYIVRLSELLAMF